MNIVTFDISQAWKFFLGTARTKTSLHHGSQCFLLHVNVRLCTIKLDFQAVMGPLVSMSSIKSSLKLAVYRGLHVSGLTRAAVPLLGTRGVILTFHEINDDLDRELSTGCPTVLLEWCINWLRKAGWEIVTLGEALDRLGSNEPAQRFAVFTFDDGYRDNVTRALPILRREQVPFTMYVPTGAITRELFAWWLGLREIFRTNEKVEIAAMGRSFSCPGLPSKVSGLAAATRWALKNYPQIPDLRHTFLSYGISLHALCDRYFINEGELRSLARDPLASIGAHTVSHRPLAILNAVDASSELVDNRAYLQARVETDVIDLAYPFGNPPACGPREAKLAFEAGFRTAVTTSNRPVFAQDLQHLYTLPRVSIHPHWTPAHLDVEVSGFTPAAARRFLPS
jgi:peptidoglycan/xylan/chitin deacetylase (PgdA/CDA1 family)